MCEKPISSEQMLYNLINSMMDKCEPYMFARLLFENQFVKDGYEFDWNKRLNENGEWEKIR